MLAVQARDFDTAVRAMALRQERWPEHRLQGHLQPGRFYADAMKNPAKAVEAFRSALALAPVDQRAAVQREIRPAYWAPLGLPAGPASAPAGSAQTSASNS